MGAFMYTFVREDTGEYVEIPFEEMLQQDVAGYVTLSDGVRARRVNDFSRQRPPREPQNANRTPPVSDTLGFQARQLAEFEDDRVRNGFVGVEFKPDPTCPEFYQVHFASHATRDKYMAHRSFFDQNKTVGSALTPQDLASAEEYAKTIGK
jgi:hypothetical protein